MEWLDGPGVNTLRRTAGADPPFPPRSLPRSRSYPMGGPTPGRSISARSAACGAPGSSGASGTAEIPQFPAKRRRSSMKSKMVFGALLLSVALCSQGFGDLFGRISGLRDGGCAPCAAPAPCEQPKACAPEPCGPACEPCGRPKRCDLFKGLRDLFACHRCGKVECACEPVKVCEKPACAPACEVCPPVRKVKRCKPACEPACEVAKPCEPACEVCKAPKCRRCHPVRDRVVCFLNNLFTCHRCKPVCGEVGCEVGCAGCGGAPAGPAPAPKPAGQPAPLPMPPAKPDPSAMLLQPRSIVQN